MSHTHLPESGSKPVPPKVVIRLVKSPQPASTTMPRLPKALTLVSMSSSAAWFQVPAVNAAPGSVATPASCSIFLLYQKTIGLQSTGSP